MLLHTGKVFFAESRAYPQITQMTQMKKAKDLKICENRRNLRITLLPQTRPEPPGALHVFAVRFAKVLDHHLFFRRDARRVHHGERPQVDDCDQHVGREQRQADAEDKEGRVHRVAHVFIRPALHHLVLLGQGQHRRPVLAERLVRPAEQEDAQRRDKHPAPAQPARQGQGGKIDQAGQVERQQNEGQGKQAEEQRLLPGIDARVFQSAFDAPLVIEPHAKVGQP